MDRERKEIRLREIGGEWVVECAGESIVAPFPLTNAEYDSEEYREAVHAQGARFMDMVLTAPPLSAEFMVVVRWIATEFDCIAFFLPNSEKR